MTDWLDDDMMLAEHLYLSALQGSRLFANGLQGDVELALDNQLFVVLDDASLRGHASRGGSGNYLRVSSLSL